MYAQIGAQLGADGVAAALHLLRPMLQGSLPGNAIARRKAIVAKG